MKPNDEALDLDKLVAKVNRSDISSTSVIVNKILQVVRDQNASAMQLRDVMEVDPTLTAKVLKRANSAYYAVPKAISSVQQAIVFLGFSTIRELAMSMTVGSLFGGEATIGGYSRKKLWKHSLAVAMLCKDIYQKEFNDSGDDVYSIGLLHDFGVIVEEQFLKSGFKNAIAQTFEKRTNLHEEEKAVFGYDHCAISKKIMKLWNLPDEFSVASGFHHRPFAAPPDHAQATKTLFIADFMCQKYGIGMPAFTMLDEAAFAKCLEQLNLDAQAVELILEDVQEELQRLEDAGEL